LPQKFLSERDVEHYLKRLFEDVQDFSDIRSDVPIGSGRADLVIYSEQRPYIVIEVKRQRIDPFDIDVVNQAASYATESGASYFATTNGTKFVLFETFKAGVPLMQRRQKVFNVTNNLAEEVLEQFIHGVKWLELDDAFLARLSALHEVVSPLTLDALRDRLNSTTFRKSFEGWVQEQGFAFEHVKEKEHTLKIISSQASYLLVNKILFYKILETGYSDLPKLRIASPSHLAEQLQRHFDAVLRIDYRAVFERGIFDEIPLPNDVAETLGKFIRELESYDFSKIKSDVIGRIYERLIPISERKALGQYYTPPQIVDLIVRLTLKDPDAKILDPACGSGSFLVKAYHWLLGLKGKERATSQKEHQQILDQLVGVEINQFPAHLSVINLEMQNIGFRSDQINVLVSDFFDVKNFGFNHAHKLANLEKKDTKAATYRLFDAAVANPPYIRQEQIKQKQKILQLMNYYGVKLDKTSDIYTYFFVHATNFLRHGGRLGFITSNKWLEVKYGESLQKFFLDNHRILMVIEFDAGAFEEALVNTCVVVLEKEKDAAKRDTNMVKFVRVKRPATTSGLVEAIEKPSKSVEDKTLRITLVPQGDLRKMTKWSIWLRAPPIYHKIVNKPKMTTLGNVADVTYGIKTGAKGFFYVDTRTIKAWGLEKSYLKPAVTSPRETEGLVFDKDKVKKFVIDVHKDKTKLNSTNMLKYLEYGEEKKYHLRPTTKNRKKWYDIGERSPAPILCARLVWTRLFFVWNKANALANDIFYEIRPHNDDDTILLLGFLNSSLAGLLFESVGRSYGGGVLELKVYEAKEFPVVNPSAIHPEHRKRIESGFVNLCEKQTDANQKRLDNVVFDALGLTEEMRKEVFEALKESRKLRDLRRGKEVLIEGD